MFKVIHLVKCQAVDVKIRLMDDCYNELPVSHDNSIWFMQPLTHILTKYSTKVSCSSNMPAAYLIGSQLIALTPNLVYIQESDFSTFGKLENSQNDFKNELVNSLKPKHILDNVPESKSFYESTKKFVEKYLQLLIVIGHAWCIVYVTKNGISLWKRFKSYIWDRNSNNLENAPNDEAVVVKT